MAVRRAFRHIGGADAAAGTGLVLDNHRPAEAISQFGCDDAGNRVVRCPAWIPYDNSDSVRGVEVLRARAGDCCQQSNGKIDTFEFHSSLSFAGNQGMYFSS